MEGFLSYWVYCGMEIPWWAPSVLYAILTSIFTGILAPITVKYLFGYLELRRKKRLEKEEALRLKIQRHTACRNLIDYNISNQVLPNELDKYRADISSQGISEEFSAKVEGYIENYQKLQDWLTASKLAIKFIIETHVKGDLPMTKKEYALDDILEDICTPLFVEGQRVTKSLIEENFPPAHKDIIKNLKEPETETKLDQFFLSLNRAIESNPILNRFRKEKKELIEFGKKLIEDLDHEIEQLRREVV